MLRALDQFPQLNDGFEVVDGEPVRDHARSVNLGVAIDLAKKDGTRTLLVPNIKDANKLGFSEFIEAYDDVIKRAREGKLQIADFQGTTISLTNPGHDWDRCFDTAFDGGPIADHRHWRN